MPNVQIESLSNAGLDSFIRYLYAFNESLCLRV